VALAKSIVCGFKEIKSRGAPQRAAEAKNEISLSFSRAQSLLKLLAGRENRDFYMPNEINLALCFHNELCADAFWYLLGTKPNKNSSPEASCCLLGFSLHTCARLSPASTDVIMRRY
jgi:hypothetical protein